MSEAQNLVKNANSTIAKDIQDGYLPTEAVNRLNEVHGFDNLALKNATALVGKPLKVPPTTSQAAKIAKDNERFKRPVNEASDESLVPSDAADALVAFVKDNEKTNEDKLREFIKNSISELK